MSNAGPGVHRLVIPTSVAAPDPGWFTSADVVVIGSGAATEVGMTSRCAPGPAMLICAT